MADLGLNIKIKASADQASQRISRLSNATAKATGNFKSHQVALHQSSARMIQLSKDANRTSDSLLRLGGSSAKLTSMLKGGAMFAGVTLAFRAMQNFVAEHTNMAMTAIETNNLFAVSFGDMAEKVETEIQSISRATGLHETAMKNISGTYNLLARSMGFNSDQASTLSMNTMKLGYDLSSLMNVPVDQVMQDLRSGLIGQSEAVYKYGIDVTEASIKQEALNQGISKSVREMSQGEKMYLRQIVMLKQTSIAHGDFARTIEEPANQLRILQQRFALLSETIGRLFIPILAKILPVANAVIMILVDMVRAIGKFFGIDMDTSIKKTSKSAIGLGSGLKGVNTNLGNVAKASDKSLGKTNKNLKKTGKEADDTTKKLRKMANALLGIDEINLLKQPEADLNKTDEKLPSVGGVGSLPKIPSIGDSFDGLGGVFDGLELPNFDNGLANIKMKADEIKQKIDEWIRSFVEISKKWLPTILVLVGLIGVAFLSWKIAGLIGNGGALKAIISLLHTIILKVWVASDAIRDFFISAQFKNASGIFLIISGLVLVFLGLRDILTQAKPPLEAFLKVFAGLALIAVGLSLLFAGFPLLIALVVGAVITLGLAIWKYWEEIVAWISEVWEGFKTTLGDLGTWIGEKWDAITLYFSELWSGIKTYFVETWEGMKTKFGEIMEGIRLFFTEKWEAIKLFVTETIPKIIGDIITWFSELPDKIAYWLGFAVGKILRFGIDIYDWATTEIPKFIGNIVKFFAELPQKIKDKLSEVFNKIKDWISNSITLVKEEVPKIIAKIRDFFGEVAGKVKEKLALVKEKIVEWVKNAVRWVTEEVPKIINAIVDWFAKLPAKIKEKIDLVKDTIAKWVTDAIGWVSTEVPKVINKVVDFFAELPQKIKEKIGALKDKFVEIGENILDGIFNGLANIGKKIKGWTDNFLKGVKDGLGIKSPSKVFRKEVGVHLGDGIALGLEDSKRGIVDTAVGITTGLKSVFKDVSMSAGVEYEVSSVNVPKLDGTNLVGSVNANSILNGDRLVENIYNAVFNGMITAMGSDSDRDLVFKVGNSELGRIAINAINSVTKQEGRLLLQI